MTLSRSLLFSSRLPFMSKGLIFHPQGMEESRSCHERPSAKIKLSDSLGLLWAHSSSCCQHWCGGCPASEWRRTIGVSEHGVEWSGEVVGEGTAVVFLGHGHEAGESDKEQQEQLEGESSPEDPEQEGPTCPRWPGFRKGGIAATFCGPEGKNRHEQLNSNTGWALLLALAPSWDVKGHAKHHPIRQWVASPLQGAHVIT